MRIESILVPELPPLAWLLHLSSSSDRAALHHGRSVAASTDGFAEGAWNAPFDLSSLRSATRVLGSGGWIDGQDVCVRTPTHTLERIWVLASDGRTALSNSLPLLLAGTTTRLDLGYPFYEADFLSFILGGAALRRRVPLAGGAVLQQFLDGVLRVTQSGALSFSPNTFAPEYHSFEDYRDHLGATCQAVAANARAGTRPRQYEPLATVSRGYDSPACAVLARECGATRGLTFAEARSGYNDTVDDGWEIGRLLGLTVERLDRHAYRTGSGDAELQFLASGGGAEDVVLSAASRLLPGSVLFTGFLGDTLWGLQSLPRRSVVGRITYPGGGSIGEYRLAADFVHLPLPILDLRSHYFVQTISRSAAMQPWRLGSEYDRPIPRRITETAGVPRDAFGANKMAVTMPMYYDQPVGEVLSPKAARDFEAYAADHVGALDSMVTRARVAVPRYALWLRERLTWRLAGRPGFGTLIDRLEPTLADRGRRNVSSSLLLLPWAVDRLQARYHRALTLSGGASA